MKLIDGLGFFMRFDFRAMLLIEFCRPAGFAKLSVYLFRPAVITDGLTLTIDFFHAILCLSDEGFLFFIGRLQIINLLFQFFRRSDVMLFQEDDRLRDCIDVVTLSPHLIAFALSGAQLAFDVDQPLDLH